MKHGPLGGKITTARRFAFVRACGERIRLAETAERCRSRAHRGNAPEILAESRRESGYILSSPLGNPVDLHNLAARVVIPALAVCAECRKAKKEHDTNGHEFQSLPAWHGWYGLRRGLATLATSLDSQLAAKSLCPTLKRPYDAAVLHQERSGGCDSRRRKNGCVVSKVREHG